MPRFNTTKHILPRGENFLAHQVRRAFERTRQALAS